MDCENGAVSRAMVSSDSLCVTLHLPVWLRSRAWMGPRYPDLVAALEAGLNSGMRFTADGAAAVEMRVAALNFCCRG